MTGWWRVFLPPHGCDVRRLVGWALIGFALIRLFQLPAVGSVDLDWILPIAWWVTPGVKLGIGLGLLATSGYWRLRRPGLAMTMVAAVYCSVLARAAWPTLNGVLIYVLMVWALLGESASRHECY